MAEDIYNITHIDEITSIADKTVADYKQNIDIQQFTLSSALNGNMLNGIELELQNLSAENMTKMLSSFDMSATATAAEKAKKLSSECICDKLPEYQVQIAKQKANAAINEARQKLAKIPEDVINNLQKTIQKLTKIINGNEDTSSESFDSDKVISEIHALLDPVVESLTEIIDSVGLPSIPGLSEISDLLNALSQMKPSEHQQPGKLPDLPADLMQTLSDLLAAVQSLCTTLPMTCVNILFNAVDLILGAQIPVVDLSLYDIIGMVPYIKEIRQLVELAPKITEVVTNVPGKISTAVQGKLKQQLKAINDLQIPSIPESIDVQIPTTCQKHA